MTRDPAHPRHDWTLAEVEALFELPFPELVFQAAAVHRRWFDPTEMQLSQLLSVKTGGCAENCGYCSQSAHFDTGAEGRPADGRRTAVIAAGRAGQGRRGAALLHGRGLARAEGPRPRQARGHDLGGEGAGPGDLRHARHADAGPGGRAEGGRPRLLQPQPRHRAGLLRRRRDHPHLSGPAATRWRHVRAAGMSACCGGIVGMGETPDGPGRPAARAGHPARPSRQPAGQRPGADRRHAAGRQ